MKLVLERLQLEPTWTIGRLSVDGAFECWTLEDTVRPEGEPKVHGQTAIPYGTYPVIVDWSTRFARMMAHVLDVPGFSGIRIHAGNTAADTEGCVLVGMDRMGDGTLRRSRRALDDLQAKLQAALDAGEAVTLEVTKPQPGEVVA